MKLGNYKISADMLIVLIIVVLIVSIVTIVTSIIEVNRINSELFSKAKEEKWNCTIDGNVVDINNVDLDKYRLRFFLYSEEDKEINFGKHRYRRIYTNN